MKLACPYCGSNEILVEESDPRYSTDGYGILYAYCTCECGESFTARYFMELKEINK